VFGVVAVVFMRSTLQSSVLVGLLTLAGCGGGPTTPVATSDKNAAPIDTNRNKKPPTVTAVKNAPQSDDAVRAASAAGARYTIMCTKVAGEGHERLARLQKDSLIRTTNRPDFYVIHSADYSEILYGYYKDHDRDANPAEFDRAERDLKWLKGRGGAGGGQFPGSIIVPLPSPDPEANPEWNLAKLDLNKPVTDPKRAYWSVAIAAYTSDARDESGQPLDRKQAAVDSVKAARAAGIPAYYWHGETTSNVCIGVWPRNAIREQERSDAQSVSESSANAGQDLVVSPGALPPGAAEDLEARHNVKVFQPKIEILDPSLAKTMKDYQEYSVNSAIQINKITDPRTGVVTERPQKSFLIEIPRQQASQLGRPAGGGGGGAAEPSAPLLIDPSRPAAGGRLRSVGQ
jgi:hypothetical protein